jgi:hypothetical protein
MESCIAAPVACNEALNVISGPIALLISIVRIAKELDP